MQQQLQQQLVSSQEGSEIQHQGAIQKHAAGPQPMHEGPGTAAASAAKHSAGAGEFGVTSALAGLDHSSW
ncbi:MAG: hypothetical protein EBW20_09095 [Betaproteobacteria bacterium]|nr:hypothetical protein [Betaproteobacteria bacterium]